MMINSWMHWPAEEVEMPAAVNDFVFGGASLPEGWTLTRASAALTRGANGRWVSAAANVPRPYHDPVTLANRGLLLEPPRTQLIYSSRPLVITPLAAAFTTDTTTQTPFGLGGKLLIEDATNTSHGFNLFFGNTTRAATIPDGSTVSLQLVFKPVGGLTRATVFAQLKTAAYQTVAFSFPPDSEPSIVSHDMVSAKIERDTDGHFRLEFTVNYGVGTTGGAAHLSFQQESGTRFYAGNGSRGMLIAFYGAELGTECTSPIITAGTSLSRSEDVLTSRPDWLKVGPKSIGIQFTPIDTEPHVIMSATGTDGFEFHTTGNSVYNSMNVGSTNIALLTGTAPPAGVERTNIMTMAYNEFWLAQGGKKLAFDNQGGIPNAFDNLRISGRVNGGALPGPMLLKRIKHWGEALDREAAAAFSGDLSIPGVEPVLPVIEVQATRTVPANEATVSLTVTLAGEPTGARVQYRTIDGTAIAGTDYVGAVGVLEFEPGESVVLLTISLGVRSLEQTRAFTLELSAPSGAVLGNHLCVITLTKATASAHAPLKLVNFSGALSADWSFTRSTAGFTRGSNGVWTSVAANQPRICHSAADDIGVLLEPATTQCLFDSSHFGYTANSTRTQLTNGTTPTGARYMTWRETAVLGNHLMRAAWNTTQATWPVGDFTLWGFFKPVGPRTRYKFTTKGIDGVYKSAFFEMSGAGSVASTTATDVIAMIETVPFFPGWYRIGVARTQAVTANVSAEWDIGPVDPATNSNQLQGDTTYGLDICHFQCEPGLFWTSPIPVAAATAVTPRGIDVLKAAGGWQSRNSFALGVKFKRLGDVPASQRIVQFRDAAPSVDDYGLLTVDGALRSPLTTDATFHSNINGPATTVGAYTTAVVSIDTERYALFAGGAKVGEIAMAGKTMPELVEHLRFGSKEQDASQAAPIIIQTAAYWALGMSDDEGIVFSGDLSGTPPGEVEPAPLPVVSIPAALNVNEGSSINVPITKVGNGACSVNFRTAAQTASFGVDYTGIGNPDPAHPNARIVTFAANESSKIVTVQTTADTNTAEGNEKIGIHIGLVNPNSPDCQLGNATGVVTIVEAAKPPDDATIYNRDRGFATHVNCGEGKSYYYVTNLNNSGAGSLRDALSASNRNIIFEVGGTIMLSSNITVTASNISVQGETAPYPGIIIQKYELNSAGSNQRFSHLTLEKGHDNSDYGVNNGDCVKVSPGSGSSTWTRSNVHYDHCLFLWSQDEMVEVWPSGGNLSGVSFSNCYFAEALYKPQDYGNYRPHYKVDDGVYNQENHTYGLLLGHHVKRVDVQNSVFADLAMRCPFVDHSTSVVVANTIAHNCGKGATIQHNSSPAPDERMLVTVKGYLCISGPKSGQHAGLRFHSYKNPMYPGTRVCWSNLYGWKGGSSTSTYPTPGTVAEYNSTQGKPYCTESGSRVNVEVSTPPIDIPSYPVAARSANDIYARALKNSGPHPKNRFNHAIRVIGKLERKAGAWVDHELQVGGRSASIKRDRKLDGTTKFPDGTTIPAPPTATDVTAVNAWLNLFRKQVQYDFD
jgi:hypothetical protein